MRSSHTKIVESKSVFNNSLSGVQILYLIGSFLIFLGAIGLIFFNWQNLGGVWKTLAISSGVITLYLLAIFSLLYSNIERLDSIFLFFAGALTPMLFLSLLTNGFTFYMDAASNKVVWFLAFEFAAIWGIITYLIFPRKTLLIIWPIFGFIAIVPLAFIFNLTMSYQILSLTLINGISYLIVAHYLRDIPGLNKIKIFENSLFKEDHASILEMISAFIIFLSISLYTYDITSSDSFFIRLLPTFVLLGIIIYTGVKKKLYWAYIGFAFLLYNILIFNGEALVRIFSWPILFTVVGVVIISLALFVGSLKGK